MKLLDAVGLFLVPIGELESWGAHLSIETKQKYKQEWALESAKKIEEQGEVEKGSEADKDIWKFCRKVGEFFVQNPGAKKLEEIPSS